jgi:hypothetical protein
MDNQRARGCLRRNTCFSGVRAVAAVEVVGLHAVESTMGAATILADYFCFLTVGNRISPSAELRVVRQKMIKTTVFYTFLCISGELAPFCDDVMLTSSWARVRRR